MNEKGKAKGLYTQGSVKERIEAFFLDNVGKVVTREQIIQVAKDPKTGNEPENWHQRLSELRTDDGYTILSWRDREGLKVGEYMMSTSQKRQTAKKRVGVIIDLTGDRLNLHSSFSSFFLRLNSKDTVFIPKFQSPHANNSTYTNICHRILQAKVCLHVSR